MKRRKRRIVLRRRMNEVLREIDRIGIGLILVHMTYKPIIRYAMQYRYPNTSVGGEVFLLAGIFFLGFWLTGVIIDAFNGYRV